MLKVLQHCFKVVSVIKMHCLLLFSFIFSFYTLLRFIVWMPSNLFCFFMRWWKVIRQHQASVIILGPETSSFSNEWLWPAFSSLRQNEEPLLLLLFKPIWLHWLTIVASQMCVCISECLREKLWVRVEQRMALCTVRLLCLSVCLCFWVCTYGFVDVSVRGCIRILAPGQPEWGRDWWLVYCRESLLN